MSRRSRGRGRIGLALVLIALGALAYVFRPQGDGPREGSIVVQDAVPAESTPPRSYRIAYRVESFGEEGDPRVSIETVTVRRPFDSHVAGRAPDDSRTSTVAAFARYVVDEQVFAVPPGMPPGDRRPDAMLAEAVEDGYATERERRRVAGRVCQVYRLGEGPDAQSLPEVSGDGDHNEICVDGAGLVLEEIAVASGDVVSRRIATDVAISPDIDDDLFEVPVPEGDPRQVGSVRELEQDSPIPGDHYWAPSEAPEGFELRGRFAVVPPAQPGFNDVTARGNIVAWVSEVWTNGLDVLVIDQGATQGAKPFEPDPNAREVEIDDIGDGELRYSLRESELRFLTGGARFLRVRGSLAPSRLVDVATSLERKPGGELVVKDD